MRILHVTNDMEMGGVQVYLSHLLPDLAKRGHSPALALVSGTGALLSQLSIPWRYIPAIGRRGRGKWPRWQAVGELCRYIEEFSPDIVQTHLLIGNTVGRLAALRSRPRPVIVATEHSTYFAKPWWARRVDQWLARHTDGIMAVSDTVARFTSEQEQIPREKFHTVCLGLPFDPAAQSSALEHDAQWPQGRPLIGIVGRLHPDKGHDWFLEIVAALKTLRPGILGIIVGEGSLRPQLEQRAHNLGLFPDHVRFLGQIEDIRQITKRLDVFLLPSKREGFGLAPLEALSLGVPVVLSRIPAFMELTNGGKYGTLVPLLPEANLTDWVDAVESVLSHPPDPIPLQRYVADRYSWDGHVDQLLHWYRTLSR